MKRTAAICALALGVAACSGNPFDDDDDPDTNPDESDGSVFLDQNDRLVVNNIEYDEDNDILVINNIPFDDPNNEYVRVTTEAFVNGFDAYQSDPEPGSAELQYFAIFRRSDSGNSQVAASTSAEYIGFGFGGGGAQRLGSDPSLPTSGLYTYNGEYGAVRTVLNSIGNGDRVEYVTGDVELAADFGDFDDIGAVNGTIDNRNLYDENGTLLGSIAGGISLANGEIDSVTGTIGSTTAVALDANGVSTGSGNWEGVFAGPNGEEIAGILFIDGTHEVTGESVREIGGLIATR